MTLLHWHLSSNYDLLMQEKFIRTREYYLNFRYFVDYSRSYINCHWNHDVYVYVYICVTYTFSCFLRFLWMLLYRVSTPNPKWAVSEVVRSWRIIRLIVRSTGATRMLPFVKFIRHVVLRLIGVDCSLNMQFKKKHVGQNSHTHSKAFWGDDINLF